MFYWKFIESGAMSVSFASRDDIQMSQISQNVTN